LIPNLREIIVEVTPYAESFELELLFDNFRLANVVDDSEIDREAEEESMEQTLCVDSSSFYQFNRVYQSLILFPFISGKSTLELV
jgi:hypothetical protein